MNVNKGLTLGMDEFYNLNSTQQLIIIQSSIPFIKQAIDIIDINPSPFPIILADFGSSHGSNSVYVMKLIINHIKERIKTDRSFLIIHNDLPTNDWNSLFNVLNQQDKNYFGLANGKSFYDQCLPSNTLTIGYTSSSIHWLSQKPCNISNHCVCIPLKCEQIEAFRSQARDDYEQFLKNRSRELINGGVLIANIISANDQGESMFGDAFDFLYECAKLVGFNDEELINFTIPAYFRSYNECCDNELFKKYSFKLIKSDISYFDFQFYEQWKKGDITIDEYAKLQTGFIRCISQVILKESLQMNNSRSKEETDQLLNRFWDIYYKQVKLNPEQFKTRSYQTNLILKKN